MPDREPSPGPPSLPSPVPPGSSLTVRELIDRRYSCRTYLPAPIPGDTRRQLVDYMAAATVGALGSTARFGLIAASPGDRDALKRLGTYGFIKGATGFIVGAVGKAPKDHEDYGYLLEQVILYATGLGLGTCWLGGTFTRSTFVRRFGGLRRGEIMPAVVSIGLIGDDGTERIREREEGGRRLPSEELFYDGGFDTPLDTAAIGAYAEALEAVRMAPSATNKQPWRLVRSGAEWHFYMRRYKHYGKRTPLFTVLRIADLQRVDLGIAMSHFELVARERGLNGAWAVRDPGIPLPGRDAEYVATWVAEG